jgi:negative regulator of flagellin synthesis FlgM
MKITNSINNHVMAKAASSASKVTTDTAVQGLKQTTEVNRKADNFVNISDKLAPTSDIDMDKVNRLSALLAEGKLSLDLDILTDSIVEMHRR